jgi:hypothetical protein
MEASEKPQLSLDDPASGGTVRVVEDRLVVERLTVTDERSARVVRERAGAGHEPALTVRDAIEIGARVLEREGTAAEVAYVRGEIERELGKLNQELTGTLEAGNEEFAERIAVAFGADRSDSVQRQIAELVAKANEDQRLAIARLFSSEDGANPLTDFKAAMVRGMKELDARRQRDREADRRQVEELTRELVTLRERFGAKEVLEAEQARGTAKGFGFEERVHDAIEAIAAARGDAASHTGGEVAEGGGKKGDTLVEVGGCDGPAQGRIVFEAKDKRLSKNDAWAELNDGMAARAASFGVLVVAGEDRIPAGREQLHEYGGNKMIVAVDRDEPGGQALALAYRLAIARVAMARDRDLTVDAVAVRDAAEDAVSTLKQAQAIRSTLTGIKTSSDKARAGLDGMVAAVEAKLQRIDSLVAEADAVPDA